MNNSNLFINSEGRLVAKGDTTLPIIGLYTWRAFRYTWLYDYNYDIYGRTTRR
jgi:hypothetical protein